MIAEVADDLLLLVDRVLHLGFLEREREGNERERRERKEWEMR